MNNPHEKAWQLASNYPHQASASGMSRFLTAGKAICSCSQEPSGGITSAPDAATTHVLQVGAKKVVKSTPQLAGNITHSIPASYPLSIPNSRS